MSVLPSVRAELVERFIFNFRMSPAALRKSLPVPWLAPQEINGFAVASYCLLDMRNLTVAPLPTVAGLHSLSCAPRYAVIDESGATPKPAVFVTERFTNSAFGAWFTGLGFSAPHPLVDARIEHQESLATLRVLAADDEPVFSARVRETEKMDSQLWRSASEFVDFIAQGVSSYGVSRHSGRLTKLDLHKEDAAYQPLQVLEIGGSAISAWQQDGAILDSAFRTVGGRYQWTYHGLTNENQT